MTARAPAEGRRLPGGLRLGVAALSAPASVLVPGARLLAASGGRDVGTLLAARSSICHWSVLSRVGNGLLPRERGCSKSHYKKDAKDRFGRCRSDRSGTLPTAPVGLAWLGLVFFLVGGPGANRGHQLLRGERNLLAPAEGEREPRHDREVGVARDPFCAAHLERCSHPVATGPVSW